MAAEVPIRIKVVDEATGQIKTIQGSLVGMSNTATSALGGLKGALGGLGASLGAAGVAKYIFDANTEFQKLQTQIRTFSGSDEAAKGAFGALTQFATTTPFELKEVTKAFITFRAAGIQVSQGMMTDFGNMASAMGGSIADMAEAVRAATTGEMERLKQFGVVARLQGDQIQASFNGVTTTVGRNAADITKYLQGISQQNFAGAMERQMKTLGGATSNLQDAAFNLATALGESGLSGSMVGAISKLTAFLDSLRKNELGLKQFGVVATGVASASLNTLKLVFNYLRGFVDAVTDFFVMTSGGIYKLITEGPAAAGEWFKEKSATLADNLRKNAGAVGQAAVDIVASGRKMYDELDQAEYDYEHKRFKAGKKKGDPLSVGKATSTGSTAPGKKTKDKKDPDEWLNDLTQQVQTATGATAPLGAALIGVRDRMRDFNSEVEASKLANGGAIPADATQRAQAFQAEIAGLAAQLDKAGVSGETKAKVVKLLSSAMQEGSGIAKDYAEQMKDSGEAFWKAVNAPTEQMMTNIGQQLDLARARVGKDGILPLPPDFKKRVEEARVQVEDMIAALNGKDDQASTENRQKYIDWLNQIKQAQADIAESETANTRKNGGFFQQLGLSISDALGNMQTFSDMMGGVVKQTISDMGSMMFDIFKAMADGSMAAGEALKRGLVGAVVTAAKAVGQFTMLQGAKNLAEAISKPLDAPRLVPSGLKLIAIGGAMMALSGAAAGALGGGSGGGGAGGGGSSAQSADSLKGAARGEATIVVKGGKIDMNDPAQAEEWAGAINELSATRKINFVVES